MAEGRNRAHWQHTSSVLALFANAHRDPRKRARPFRPDDFDPTRKRRRGKGRAISVSRLVDDLMGPVEKKRGR